MWDMMARIKYGKKFRSKRGRYGRYKYVNGRRVAFVRAGRKAKRYWKKRYSRYRNRRW